LAIVVFKQEMGTYLTPVNNWCTY